MADRGRGKGARAIDGQQHGLDRGRMALFAISGRGDTKRAEPWRSSHSSYYACSIFNSAIAALAAAARTSEAARYRNRRVVLEHHPHSGVQVRTAWA